MKIYIYVLMLLLLSNIVVGTYFTQDKQVNGTYVNEIINEFDYDIFNSVDEVNFTSTDKQLNETHIQLGACLTSYRYYEETKELLANPRVSIIIYSTNTLTKEEIKETIVHEIGHVVFFSRLQYAYQIDDTKSEIFAENYRLS